MNKTLYFVIIAKLLTIPFFAKEPQLAILQSVHSNSSQIFSIRQSKIICKTYGVTSIDDLYQIAKNNSNCKNGIDEFYRQNPIAKYYSSNLLKLRQTYHVEFKAKRCIIYAKGLNTLSELLLKEGLAVKNTKFKDEEFDMLFNEAQIQAKEHNIGMYKNKINNKCIEELFSIQRTLN